MGLNSLTSQTPRQNPLVKNFSSRNYTLLKKLASLILLDAERKTPRLIFQQLTPSHNSAMTSTMLQMKTESAIFLPGIG